MKWAETMKHSKFRDNSEVQYWLTKSTIQIRSDSNLLVKCTSKKTTLTFYDMASSHATWKTQFILVYDLCHPVDPLTIPICDPLWENQQFGMKMAF